MGQSRPLFLFIFVFSSCHNLKSNFKSISVDGVLAIRTRGSRVEGADESTELLWHFQHPKLFVGQIFRKCVSFNLSLLKCIHQRDFTQTISVRIPLKLYRFFCNIVVETSENEKRGRVGPFFKKAAFDIQLLYLFLKWDSGLWQLIKRLKHVKKKIAQKIIFDNCFF